MSILSVVDSENLSNSLMILSRCKETADVASSLEDHLVLLSFFRLPAPASFSLAHPWGELDTRHSDTRGDRPTVASGAWVWLFRLLASILVSDSDRDTGATVQ